MKKSILKKLGLIGYPLSHSFSPRYFADKFKKLGITDYQYNLYPLEHINDVCDLLHGDLVGLNVTIPYKQQVIPFLDHISEEAKAIGAVNTIKISNGRSVGYNTDVYGFEVSLKRLLDGTKPQGALILGTGGAAKAVKYVLSKLGINHLSVSRTSGDILYKNVDQQVMHAHRLIINTTPLGMYPNIESAPELPYQYLTSDHYLFDLIYNPELTLFMNYGVCLLYTSPSPRD